MNIKQALKKYHKIEIELLLAHVLKKPKEFVFLHPEFRLSAYSLTRLLALVKRREKGEPVAYILEYKDFMGLRFKVNSSVLIPRPETERLVESVKLKVESMGQKKIKILDVGTGSGCIAVSLARQFQIPNSIYQITASDISKKALTVAKQNAEHHKVKIKFIQSDLLKKIKFNPDIIVANLPYGWSQWKNNISAETVGLKFEPKEALFTEEKGLYHIRRLLEQLASRKNKPKLVFLEFDPRQKQGLQKMIKKYLPFSKAEFYKDLNNFWRFVEIEL